MGDVGGQAERTCLLYIRVREGDEVGGGEDEGGRLTDRCIGLDAFTQASILCSPAKGDAPHSRLYRLVWHLFAQPKTGKPHKRRTVSSSTQALCSTTVYLTCLYWGYMLVVWDCFWHLPGITKQALCHMQSNALLLYFIYDRALIHA